MQADRYPLAKAEVSPEVALLRKRACGQCPIGVVLRPDMGGARAPVCGFPESKVYPDLARGNGQPIDAGNPAGTGYGNLGQADPGWCPLGRWADEFLKQFGPIEPTEEQKTARRFQIIQNISLGLATAAKVLKQVPDEEAANLLEAAVEAGMSIETAKILAVERGLSLNDGA